MRQGIKIFFVTANPFFSVVVKDIAYLWLPLLVILIYHLIDIMAIYRQ